MFAAHPVVICICVAVPALSIGAIFGFILCGLIVSGRDYPPERWD